jgi:hypothetical protein
MTGEEITSTELDSKLNNLYQSYCDKFLLLDLISGIQSSLQSLVELMIVGDRILFLKEFGFDPKAKVLFDPDISPRRIVITCHKH